MAGIPGIRRLLRLPESEGSMARAVEEELAFHVDERTAELIEGGQEPAAARAEAMREFGDLRGAAAELEEIGRRRVRRTRRATWWSDLGQDVGYGLRASLRAPAFTMLAVTTLALGIGANAAVFGVVKSVLLDGLPFTNADRLVRVYGRMLDNAVERGAISAGSGRDLMDRQQSFVSMAAFGSTPQDVVYGGAHARVAQRAWVEPGYFGTLGVGPAQGRTFVPEDARADSAHVVVISHAAWQRLLGGDPRALGSQVMLNGVARTVIGILPSDYVDPIGVVDFYSALDLEPVLRDPVSARRSHWLGLVGRLAPGVSHEVAAQELDALAAQLAREHPDDNGAMGVRTLPLREAMAGDTRTPLIVLMASAAFVLLITCANLAGAQLSRAISRRKEFAVRAALGAGRGRILRQLVTESAVIGLAGGIAGLLLASTGLSLLRRLTIPALPEHADLALDSGAVVATLVLSLVAGVLFGLGPALTVEGINPQATLRDESRGASETRRSGRLRGALVAGQIALCVSLLAGAGLLARSLWTMTSAPLGFDPRDVLTVSLQLPATAGYETVEDLILFHQQFIDRLRTLPGIESAASVSMVPTTVMSRMGLSIDGAPPPPSGTQPFVLYAPASDDYFRTLRIPLRRGRIFDERDHAGAAPVVVVSESMARRYWPNGDALGARIRLGPDPNSPLIEVIGIVGDVRNDPARLEAEPMAYRSTRQAPWPIATFVMRAQVPPSTLVRAVERELAAIDPGLPVSRATTLRTVLGEGLAGRRLPVLLMGSFGALALLLASVGVYAMFATMAAAREREFGVRLALGSSPRAIAGLVLRQGAVWMGLGLFGGALGIILVAHLLGDLLYGVSPLDPIGLGTAVAMLLACAALALLTPVRRAARVDPASALQSG